MTATYLCRSAFLGVVLAITVPSNAQLPGSPTEKKLNQLTASLDALEAESREKDSNLSDKQLQLDRKMQSFEETAGKLGSATQVLTSQVTNVQDTANRLSNQLSTLTEYQSDVKTLQSQMAELKVSVKDSEKNTDSLKWLIGAISAIVSILVIIISLFFSKSFMDLYANYRVLAALHEGEQKNVTANSSATSQGK